MNNKGQGFGFIRVLFLIGLFMVLFTLALAPFVNSALGGVDLSALGGFGSFVAGNFNIWVFGAFVLAVIAALVIGFRE